MASVWYWEARTTYSYNPYLTVLARMSRSSGTGKLSHLLNAAADCCVREFLHEKEYCLFHSVVCLGCSVVHNYYSEVEKTFPLFLSNTIIDPPSFAEQQVSYSRDKTRQSEGVVVSANLVANRPAVTRKGMASANAVLSVPRLRGVLLRGIWCTPFRSVSLFEFTLLVRPLRDMEEKRERPG